MIDWALEGSSVLGMLGAKLACRCVACPDGGHHCIHMRSARHLDLQARHTNGKKRSIIAIYMFCTHRMHIRTMHEAGDSWSHPNDVSAPMFVLKVMLRTAYSAATVMQMTVAALTSCTTSHMSSTTRRTARSMVPRIIGPTTGMWVTNMGTPAMGVAWHGHHSVCRHVRV